MKKFFAMLSIVAAAIGIAAKAEAIEGIDSFQIESGWLNENVLTLQLNVSFRSNVEAQYFHDRLQCDGDLAYSVSVQCERKSGALVDKVGSVANIQLNGTKVCMDCTVAIATPILRTVTSARCVITASDDGSQRTTINKATVSYADGTVDVESVGGGEDLTGGYWVTFDPGIGVRVGGGELEQYVKYGESAVEPMMAYGPFDGGYVFWGWDSYDWMYVTTDMTVSAVYEYEYTEEEPDYPTPTVYYVEFDEGEHGRISSGWWYQEVCEGQWPEVPEVEPLDGWRFVGWSPEVSEIWGDMTFVAQYEAVPKKINYVADGSTGVYCGIGFGISVRVSLPINGWTVKYSESATGSWQDTPILYRDVCDSRPVYFQITADGYETVVDSRTVTITPKQLSDYVWLVLPPEDYVYDGTPKIPEVAYEDGDPSIITENDFEVKYENNINAGIATVTIVGKGNYTGSIVEHFEIKPSSNGSDEGVAETRILWSEGFEEFSEGTHPKNSSPSHFLYGGEDADDESAVVASALDFNASCGLPSPFTSCGTKALKVNTGVDPVWISPYETTSGGKLGGRFVPEPGTALTIDAIAQFTVTPMGDEAMMGGMPEVQGGGARMMSVAAVSNRAIMIRCMGLMMPIDDKLLLYMQEGTTANNWCLLAGIDTDDGEIAEQRFTLQSADPANPIPEADPNACVRVTVKAINDAETGRLEFEVYLNGALASANGRTRFLPHPDAADRTGVSAIGFAGEGTVDNIVFSVGAVSDDDDSGVGGGTNDVVATYCEVTAVAVKPRWPWNGIVDIDYTLAIEPAGAKAMVSVAGCDTVKNQTILPKAPLEGTEEPVGAGSHRISWDIGAEYPQFHSEAFTVDVTATPVTNQTQEAGLYMVIDLSGGTNAPAYPVSYLNEVPVGGWTTEHKTNKLVMRRIEAGTFTMGNNDTTNTVQVTLTKPFYMGVFEVTQKQYELVTGSNPSSYKGNARPVENVSWNTIRGNSSIYNWPSNRTVDAASFMGIIRQKTGLGLDLPTDAQWEYACRAGTTSKYNNGDSIINDMNVLGRYYYNRNDGKGGYSQHTTVGSYLPNAWGLYDMHGNVWEWCLDWYGGLSNGTDPEGPALGSYRVVRGGSWFINGASDCTSSSRGNDGPSINGYDNGLRLACSAGL